MVLITVWFVVTFTVTVQLEEAGIVPNFNFTLVSPGASVPSNASLSTPPAQVVDAESGEATVIPAGKLSIKVAPVMAVDVGFVRVMVVVEGRPDTMVDGENILLMPGCPTPSVSLAVLPVPPLDEVTCVVVFVALPAGDPETLVVMVQLPSGTKVAPDSPTLADVPCTTVPEEPAVQLIAAVPLSVMVTGAVGVVG